LTLLFFFEAEILGFMDSPVPLSVPSPRLQTHRASPQLWAFLSNRGWFRKAVLRL